MFKPMKKTIKIDVMDPHICDDQHFVSLTCVDDQGIKLFLCCMGIKICLFIGFEHMVLFKTCGC